MRVQNLGLYVIIAGGAAVIMLLALGPGLYTTQKVPLGGWQYRAFDLLCHQLTERSYHINGVQMAVCSRCIGIYGAFLLSWLALPLLSKIDIPLKSKIGWLIGVIVLNLADVIGNFLEMWSNTLDTRLALGIFLGLAVVLLFNDEFFLQIKRIKYGR